MSEVVDLTISPVKIKVPVLKSHSHCEASRSVFCSQFGTKKLHEMLFTNQALPWRLLRMPIHYYGVQSTRVRVGTNSDTPFAFSPFFLFVGIAQVGRQNCLWGLKLMTPLCYKGHGSTRADIGGGGLRCEALKYIETCIERTTCIKVDTLIKLFRY